MRGWLAVPAVVTNILDESNDSQPILMSTAGIRSFEPLSDDDVLAGPIVSGQRFVDQYDERSVRAVVSGEEPAFQQRYSHRLKVIAGNSGPVDRNPLLCRFRGAPFQSKRQPSSNVAQ